MGTERSGRGSRRGTRAPGDPTAKRAAGPGRAGPSGRLRKAARRRPRPGRRSAPGPPRARSQGPRGGAQGTAWGARAPGPSPLRTPRCPLHASNPLSEEDWKENVFRTQGRAALETGGSDFSRKIRAAWLFLHPTAPGSHRPRARFQNGPPGWAQPLQAVRSAFSVSQTPAQKRRLSRSRKEPRLPALGC